MRPEFVCHPKTVSEQLLISLQMPLRPTIASYRQLVSSQQWLRHTCQCACGTIIHASSPSSTFSEHVATHAQKQQRRSVSRRSRPAPSTRVTRIKQDNVTVLTPKDQRRLAELQAKRAELEVSFADTVVGALYETRATTTDPRVLRNFIRECQELADAQNKLAGNKNYLNPNGFALALANMGGEAVKLLRNDQGAVSHIEWLEQSAWKRGIADARKITSLLLAFDRGQYRALAKKMLFSLSEAGDANATVRIMHQALLQNKNRPTLKSQEIVKERGRLQELAREGKHLRAMVLEGKILQALGDEENAINMYRQAMTLALGSEEPSSATVGPVIKPKINPGKDSENLASPWVELFFIHAQRSERGFKEVEAARKAMEVGCQRDDPTMFYQAAASFSQKWSSNWVYCMTKAAASGNCKAMHELACWYAESPWKWIKDEPPEHVRPTIFDSYPPEKQNTFFGRLFPPDTPSDQEAIHRDRTFQLASWPDRPQDRIRLALEWLRAAMAQTYAPACLTAAKIHLMEYIPNNLAPPRAALNLKSPKRYPFRSKDDYRYARDFDLIDPRTSLPRPGAVEDSPVSSSDYGDAKPIPNPLYDLDEAHAQLSLVLSAHSAHTYRTTKRFRTDRFKYEFEDASLAGRRLTDSSIQRRGGLTLAELQEIDDSEDIDLPDVDGPPWEMQKWWQYATVREMYEDSIDEVAAEARKLLDQMGWEVRHDNGALLYSPQEDGRKG